MKTHFTILFAALGFLILNGCITSQQPATVAANAFDQPLPAIYVMPVIDARDDKSGTLDAGDIQRIRDLTKSKLNDLGYQPVMVDSWRGVASTSDEGTCQNGRRGVVSSGPRGIQVIHGHHRQQCG